MVQDMKEYLQDAFGKLTASAVLILQSLVPVEQVRSVWHPIQVMEFLTPYLQFTGLVIGLVVGAMTAYNLYLKNKEYSNGKV